MKIAHFADFCPTLSGLYESARDFVHADEIAGRAAVFVDTGARVNDVKQSKKVGEVDDRGGWALKTVDHREAIDADVWVLHSQPSPEVLALSSCPIIWILHGRPRACFLHENATKEAASQDATKIKQFAYTFFSDQAKVPRVKIMATMIEEHVPYWANVLPKDKLRLIEHPPVDPSTYSPEGEVWDVPNPDDANVLIADSWRLDLGIFDAVNAACIAAETIPRFKLWIMGFRPFATTFNPLLVRLAELGALGIGKVPGLYARTHVMADVYRSMDVLLTSHVIPTRVMTEALACGIEVVAGARCRYTPWTAPAEMPVAVAGMLKECLGRKHEGSGWRALAPTASGARRNEFNLFDFSARMGELYNEALHEAKTHRPSGNHGSDPAHHREDQERPEANGVAKEAQKDEPIVINNKATTLDVIVPCYGQAQLTQRFMDSFGEHAPDWARLILMDNGCSEHDDEEHDDVRVPRIETIIVKISENLGFIRAVNMGLCASDAEYVCIQNNDTEIYHGCYEELISTLKANPDYGVIGAIAPNEKRGVGWSYEDLLVGGHFPGDAPEDNAVRAAWMRSNWSGQALDCGFVPFFCVVLKRSTVDQIGLLDTQFGLGLGDDDDYCRRLRDAGYKVGLARGCYVEHTGRATFDAMFTKDEQAEMSRKASKLLVAKHA